MRKWLLAIGMVLGLSALAQGGKLEIFSWWAGDEGPAPEALIRLYKQKYPGVEVINATVTGGAGVNARAVLKTRMLGGDPRTPSRCTPAWSSSAPGWWRTGWRTSPPSSARKGGSRPSPRGS